VAPKPVDNASWTGAAAAAPRGSQRLARHDMAGLERYPLGIFFVDSDEFVSLG